jgi:uncharacterized protein
MQRPMRFTSFLIKVASRCNLNCSYCYMYQHADQSWKNKPRVLSELHQKCLVNRLEEYVKAKGLSHILLVYHGGEPLIFGADRLVNLYNNIRKQLDPLGCRVDAGIQTNGVLLNEKILSAFEKQGISVSLSIDGPKEIHDVHRLDHKGKASFEKVYHAQLLLKKFPKTFTGCISVINPNFNPRLLFDFFSENGITDLNILLPDANYLSPPPGRKENPNLYKDWLINAFDCWFDHFSHIKCKFFESVLMAILGNQGQTDSLGLGDISMLNIETDGSYHDLDVLKITEENSSDLGLNLEKDPIIAAETSEKIAFHRRLLTKEGLSDKCLVCPHVNTCGGGSVPHRFGPNGYANPTVYCQEMYALMNHALARFAEHIQEQKRDTQSADPISFGESQMQAYWSCETARPLITHLQQHLAHKNYEKLRAVLDYASSSFPQKQALIEQCRDLSFDQLRPALLQPTTYSWLRAIYGHSIGSPALNIDDEELPADVGHFEKLVEGYATEGFNIQPDDPWYGYSLGRNIVLHHEPAKYAEGFSLLTQSLEIVKDYNCTLYEEMVAVSPNILLVADTQAHPDKDLSFSDETLPGAIFIGAWKSGGLLSSYQVAASLIHEHLHQKLYLLQQKFELFMPQTTQIFSPWPAQLRPPSGALHAVYVFTHLGHYWHSLLETHGATEIAEQELDITIRRLDQCIQDIQEKVIFTRTGQLFFDCLLQEYRSLSEKSLTPVS